MVIHFGTKIWKETSQLKISKQDYVGSYFDEVKVTGNITKHKFAYNVLLPVKNHIKVIIMNICMIQVL